MSRGPEAQTASAWYIHADGRVWGPYGEVRLRSFVTEGRVSRSTMIGESDQGPFIPAGLQGDLTHLFAEEPPPPARPERAPASPPPAASSGPPPLGAVKSSAPNDPFADLDAWRLPTAPAGVVPARSIASVADPAPRLGPGGDEAGLNAPVADRLSPSGASRPLLVFAALRSFGPIAFEMVLAQHGPYERIGDGLWLIRARLGSSALRNALSRRLRREDALLVVEADLENAAWFNLDLVEERRVRALWAL